MYEAAEASAAIATISEAEATQALNRAIADSVTTLVSLQSEMRALFTNELDTLFADENNVYKNPGFLSAEDAPRLSYLRNAYNSLETDLATLSQKTTITNVTDMTSTVASMRSILTTYETVSATIREMIRESSSNTQYDAITSAFLTTVATVEQTTASLQSRLTALGNTVQQAENTLAKARIGTATDTVSTADAQRKQALGSLRAAQAAYNKTIISSPIAGTVSSLLVSTGQVVSNGQVVATVSNQNAYEVVVFVTPDQADQLQLGNTVSIGDATGTIKAIAPGISSNTGKVEVRIQSTAQSLVSGESVTVSLQLANDIATESFDKLVVPLTAIKFSNETAFVYTVSEDGVLVAYQVVLGRPQGGSVTISSGVTTTMPIVADVRGLVAGQSVTVQ